MITFQVDDMSCGHCVAAITRAVKEADAGATVQVDLATHRVSVESSVDQKTIGDVIREAGYTPVSV